MNRKSLFVQRFLAGLVPPVAVFGLLALFSTPAFAADGSCPHRPGVSSSHRVVGKRWIAKLPIPPLLPIALHHARRLGLSVKQQRELKTWRAAHRAEHRILMEHWRHDRWALRRAVLAGERVKTGPLLTRLNSEIVRLERAGLDRDHVVQRTLTPSQWQLLVRMVGRLG
ncbi:MAG: hypothetical protein ACYCVY_06650 [Acidiferrobacteraceae bacterium]